MADEARQRHRQLFERFCRQKFHDGGRGCSKTISTKKRDKVIKFLTNKDQQDVSAHFRFWVKNRGFQMVEMDGQSVLCLPNKQRVSPLLPLPEYKPGKPAWTIKIWVDP